MGPATADPLRDDGPVRAAERSCTARTPVAQRPVLRAGVHGTCVQTLQNLLLTNGYSLGHGWPGGGFDANTRAAVLAFQREHDLDADAVVGPRTWTALVTAAPRSGYSRWRGPYSSDRVVLSYDDCPRSRAAFTSAVRSARDAGVSLALFPTGQCLRTGRFDAAYARSLGHWVFNHSVSHPDMRRLSLRRVRAELRAPGVVTSFGRPPYGAFDATVLRAYAAERMRVWIWTYDTVDWKGGSRPTIVRRVVDNATAGSSVLLHMQWHAFDGTAIRAMKRGLAGRGLGVCRNLGQRTALRPDRMRC